MSGNDTQGFIPALLSLQESAINTILTNIAGYGDLIKKKISPPMRKLVFDIAMKRKKDIGEEEVWAALPYLDQHRTTESFSTEDFASFFRLKGKTGEISKGHVSMEEFLQYLVEFVPNLRELEIQDPRWSYPSIEWDMFEMVRLQPLATDLLLKMENLTQLFLNGVHIQFSGFLRVCRESRNLHLIEANNILVDIPIFSVKKVLETLYPKFDHQDYASWYFPSEISITLKRTDAIKPHREASVTLSNDFLDEIPSPWTELHIYSQKSAYIQSERDCFLRNLSRVGGSLKRLSLHSIGPELNITLKLIFKHCPELESLCINNSCVSHDEPIASFGKLKHFTWYDRYLIGTLHLDRILSAPLLEYIVIDSSILDLGDTESLLKQIRNRTILTELTYIRIQYVVLQVQENLSVRDLHELDDLLRSIGVLSGQIRALIGRSTFFALRRIFIPFFTLPREIW